MPHPAGHPDDPAPLVPLLDADLPVGVRGGFTTRAGSSSSPRQQARRAGAPYAGLNLGDHVGDDPARVAAHRDALRRTVGAEHLVVPVQVHGADVVELVGPPAVAPRADALVTRTPGLALGIVVADCVPVLLADPAAGVVGVAHAGRPGLLAGVVPAVVAALRDLGATDLRVRVGPCICGSCYEVPQEMAEAVAAREPAAASRTSWGTPAVDVAAGVLAQLAALGITGTAVRRCTAEHDDLFSYRRDGTTGRSGGVVVLS